MEGNNRICGICSKYGVNIHEAFDSEPERLISTTDRALEFNLDDYAGQGVTFRGKIIADQPRIIEQIDSGRSLHAANGVVTYTFLDLGHLTGIYNNPNYGFTAGFGLSPYSDVQRTEARADIDLWDDLLGDIQGIEGRWR